ncbi:vacuolar-sorting receptor 4 [Chrysoperla carnea]|uniref:vacuolar-sorting receptor 4 n=1 Tax=Chrysoperla carnea TaxID=189513 RepID=UPI001D0644FC|nr:vacuolar-sorting receptor 4 [Chrysoperla carnea]
MARRHHHEHYHSARIEALQQQQPVQQTPGIRQQLVTEKSTNLNYQIVEADFTPYNKHAPGRHVCTSQRAVSEPVKTIEAWCKPTQKRFNQLCHNNQICHGVRLVYETAYRDVMKTKTTHKTTYVCCPGWVQHNKQSFGCHKPICTKICENGGTCVKPNICSCKKGFRGKRCEIDVNECKDQKPCDQICHNTHGSYFCECRENFILQPNKHSCKKEGIEGPALEAKDLEFDDLSHRIYKLEKLIGSDTFLANETEVLHTVQKSIQYLTNQIKYLQNQIEVMQNTNSVNMKKFEERLFLLEQRTNRILGRNINTNMIFS